jgi:hypothetical protein
MEVTVSETTGTQRIGENDERDDPSIAGKPEVPAGNAPNADEKESGRLEEREEREHGVQQHGDTFAVASDQPTDTSGLPNRQ